MLIQSLLARGPESNRPFLISSTGRLSLEEVASQETSHLDEIRAGDVVALIGDFDAQSIADLLTLIDRHVIVVPLTSATRNDHPYFFSSALVDWVVEAGVARRIVHESSHELIDKLRHSNHPGLVLFSTGTTGRPKAILHDMTHFLRRFETPRPTLRTLAFLLFDHIGGLNTLLHTLFNAGIVIQPVNRSVAGVLESCRIHDVELLPTTPTFLRMMLISGLVSDVPPSLKVITYGTERMDQPTLSQLCQELPQVDFRQTFGMSELGILRVKSKSRDSLFMKVGGEGVSTRINDGILEIFSPTRMLGYLNAPSPFDSEGWYNTNDVVESDAEFIKVVGRSSDAINVGGLKFMASDVERVVLEFPGVGLVSVVPRENPITGQHVEMTVEPAGTAELSADALRQFLVDRLPAHMVPRRIKIGQVKVGHRFKKN